MSDLDKTFFEQVREAAAISRKWCKRQLVAELIESNRLLTKDVQKINELCDRLKVCHQALLDIIELEEAESCRCYGFGDIAREALEKTKDKI